MKLYELAEKYLKKESYMRSNSYKKLLADYQEALGNGFDGVYNTHLSLNAVIAEQAFIDGFKLSMKKNGDKESLVKLRDKYITREMFKNSEEFDSYNDLYYMELQEATEGENIGEISNLRKAMDKEVVKIAFTDGYKVCLNYLNSKKEKETPKEVKKNETDDKEVDNEKAIDNIDNENMNKKYIFNLETTKIELYFDKADFDNLTDSQKRDLKSTFLWSRSRQCWVSRAKEPNLWRAKKVAKELGFEGEQREGERLSYAQQVENTSDRANARAEKYKQYAYNAISRAESLQKPINDLQGDIAFFTQPNINSSSGKSFTNYRNKLFNRYEKGFEEYRKSDYFKQRAEAARTTASNKKFKDLVYLDRRIKECKKEIKARRENIADYEQSLTDIENGKTKKSYDGSIITADELIYDINSELELIDKAMDKQAFLENCVDSLGGIKFNKDNIKVGYIVHIGDTRQAEIIGKGPVNVTYKILTGGGAGMVLKAAYAKITEVIKTDKKEMTECKEKKSV